MTILPSRGANESAESYLDRLVPPLTNALAAVDGGTALVSGGKVYVAAGAGSARGLLDIGVLASGTVVTVDSSHIEDAAVVTAKIDTAAVTTTEIADLAVASGKIANAAVVEAKIGNLAVTSAKINDMAANKLTAGTIGSHLIYLGGTEFTMSGTDKQIVIKDAQGTPETRVKIGKLSGVSTDYGLQLYDSSGNLFLDAGSNSKIYGQHVTVDALVCQDDGGSNPAIKLNGNGLDAQIKFGSSQVLKGGTNNDIAFEDHDDLFLGGASTQVTSSNDFQTTCQASFQYTGTTNFSVQAHATNASFANSVVPVLAARTASSSYNFLAAQSGFGGTPDTEFILRGDGNGYCDGSWNGGGADFAEYFESSDGKTLPIGRTVVLEQGKVRISMPDEVPFGVVRPKNGGSSIIGNTAMGRWSKKYLKDDYDGYQTETYTITEWWEDAPDKGYRDDKGKRDKFLVLKSFHTDRIPEGVIPPEDAKVLFMDSEGKQFRRRVLNPDFDSSRKYVPRENRDEWVVIGLLGQVPIKKGEPVNPNWIKMRDLGPVDLWLIR